MREDSDLPDVVQHAPGTDLVRGAEQLSPQALADHAPRYVALKAAIAECRNVDELADCADRAVAAMAYFRQSHDTSNEVECSRIRLWAERGLGEILRDMAESGQRAGRGGDRDSNVAPRDIRLEDLGIPRDRASRAQRLAVVPEEQFKSLLAEDEVAQPRRILKRWHEIEQRGVPPLEQESKSQVMPLLKVIKQLSAGIEQERLPKLKHWRAGIGEDGMNFMRGALPAITRYFAAIERQLRRKKAHAARARPPHRGHRPAPSSESCEPPEQPAS